MRALHARAAALWGTATLVLLAAGCEPSTKKKPVFPPQGEARVIVCAPGSYQSGNDCLPVKQECPEYTVMKGGQCVLEKAETEPESPKVAPPAAATDYESAVDPRHRTARSRALLISELQNMEALFASMAKNSPDRPTLVRRLAEDYVELGDAAAAESVAAQMPVDIAKALKIEQAARLSAVKYYTVLHSEYPSYCQSVNAADPTKSTGCDDEVLYFDALEYRRLKRMDDARKKLLELIQHYPGSRYIGASYFVFGEAFRSEAAGDPSKWPLAEQSYAEAAKYPGTPTTRPAFYRLAEVYENQGDKAKAAAARAKARAQQP